VAKVVRVVLALAVEPVSVPVMGAFVEVEVADQVLQASLREDQFAAAVPAEQARGLPGRQRPILAAPALWLSKGSDDGEKHTGGKQYKS